MSQEFLELGRYTKQYKTDGSNTKQPSSSAFARCTWTRCFTSPSRGRAGSDWTRSMTGQTASGCTAAPGGPRSPRSSWVASTTASNMRSAANIFGILGWAVRNRMNRQSPSDQSGFHMISNDLEPAHTHTHCLACLKRMDVGLAVACCLSNLHTGKKHMTQIAGRSVSKWRTTAKSKHDTAGKTRCSNRIAGTSGKRPFLIILVWNLELRCPTPGIRPVGPLHSRILPYVIAVFTHTLAQKHLIELLMWNASYVQKHFS